MFNYMTPLEGLAVDESCTRCGPGRGPQVGRTTMLRPPALQPSILRHLVVLSRPRQNADVCASACHRPVA